jgi:hypothetical protein
MAAKNEKVVHCTVIICIVDKHGGSEKRQARVDVQEKTVAHALQQASQRVMAQLKG